jgi:predicted dehydrogenase
MDLRQNMLRVDVAGSAGRLLVDGLTTANVVGRLRRFRFAGDASDPARAPEGEEIPLPLPPGAEPDFQLAFDGSITAFIQAIAAGQQPPVTGEDGYRVLELEHAIVRSMREGRFVAV